MRTHPWPPTTGVIVDPCRHCGNRAPLDPSDPEDRWLERRKGQGCPECDGTGIEVLCERCGEAMKPICGGRDPEATWAPDPPDCRRNNWTDRRAFAEIPHAP